MKITFVLPHVINLSGGIRVVATYAERLKKRGHEVFVVSTPDRPFTLRQKIKALLKDKRWPAQNHGASYFDDIDIEHKVLERYRPVTNEDVPDAHVVLSFQSGVRPGSRAAGRSGAVGQQSPKLPRSGHRRARALA